MGFGGTHGSSNVQQAQPGQAVSRVTKEAVEKRERVFRQSGIDRSMDPSGRLLVSEADTGHMVLGCDVTGSMGELPQVYEDKASLVAGQVDALGLLPPGSLVSLSLIGDHDHGRGFGGDKAPMQIHDFVPLNMVHEAFAKGYIEGKGGGNRVESYLAWLWFMSERVVLPEDSMSVLVLTCDEGFRPQISGKDLRMLFGPGHQYPESVTAEQVMSNLDDKFGGRIAILRRVYRAGGGCYERQVMQSWVDLVGGDRIVMLPSVEGDRARGDKAIGDLLICTIGLLSGRWNLSGALESLVKSRQQAQTAQRIGDVERALGPLAEYCQSRFLLPWGERVSPAEMEYARQVSSDTVPNVPPVRPPRGRSQSELEVNDSRGGLVWTPFGNPRGGSL